DRTPGARQRHGRVRLGAVELRHGARHRARLADAPARPGEPPRRLRTEARRSRARRRGRPRPHARRRVPPTGGTLMRFALLPLLVACAAPPGRTLQAGDFAVELAVDPDPPAPGENRLRVLVKDAGGRPVDGARLALTARMPAMGSMPEMKGGGDV